MTGSRREALGGLGFDALVVAGSDWKTMFFPDLTAFRVREAAGLEKISGVECSPSSLTGEMDQDTDHEAGVKVREVGRASLTSLGRDRAADALVGLSKRDLKGSACDDVAERKANPPRALKGGIE